VKAKAAAAASRTSSGRMELIVQVDKDERGNKGAALTTYISLAGRYLVLMPNNRAAAVCRAASKAKSATNCATRSAGSRFRRNERHRSHGGHRPSTEELQWDLNYLLQLWHAVEDAAKLQSGLS